MDKIQEQATKLAASGFVLGSSHTTYLAKIEDLLLENEPSPKKLSGSQQSRRKAVRKFLTKQAEQHIELAFLSIISLSITNLADNQTQARLLVELPVWWGAQERPVQFSKLAEEKLRRYFPAHGLLHVPISNQGLTDL